MNSFYVLLQFTRKINEYVKILVIKMFSYVIKYNLRILTFKFTKTYRYSYVIGTFIYSFYLFTYIIFKILRLN